MPSVTSFVPYRSRYPCVLSYPELRNVIGDHVPDLRGLFLRGHGGNSAALGIQQGDAIRNITGAFDNVNIKYGAFRAGNKVDNTYIGTYHGTTMSTWFDASRVVPTAEENRPVNMAVRYLIRALP